MSGPRRALLAGATGLVGSELLRQSLQNFARVDLEFVAVHLLRPLRGAFVHHFHETDGTEGRAG
jgi:hypothetical protein